MLETYVHRMYIHVCVVHIVRSAHARVYVMEAENSITLTLHSSVNVFIVLGWRSEMIMVFMNIHTRTMNT